MKTQCFVWTFTELQKEIDIIMSKWWDIDWIRFISTLTTVDSYFEDNIIRVFVLYLKKSDVPTNKQD